jgi:hypothetical protein
LLACWSCRYYWSWCPFVLQYKMTYIAAENPRNYRTTVYWTRKILSVAHWQVLDSFPIQLIVVWQICKGNVTVLRQGKT